MDFPRFNTADGLTGIALGTCCMSPLNRHLRLMSVTRLLSATDWTWDLTDFSTEVGKTEGSKERAGGSSSTAGKSGVSLIMASSSSDS